MIKNILLSILVVLTLSETSFSQQKHYEDVFYGNVVIIGLDKIDSTSFVINNLSNSVVRKAFLIYGENSVKGIEKLTKLNDDFYLLNSIKRKSDFISYSIATSTSSNKPMYVHVVDVTNSILNDSIQFFSEIHSTSDSNNVYEGYSLVILYDNYLLDKINFIIWLNDKDVNYENNYFYGNTNPIDTLKKTSLSLSLSHMTFSPTDGSFVSVNNYDVGLVYGPSEYNLNNSSYNILGQHYYVNGQIIDIGDDTGDSLMNGSDVLADISSYCNQYDTSISVKLTYQDPNANEFAYTSNILWSTTLAYTTPCDTFSVSVPNDTTVCRGTQLQLNVTGGQKYEWLPSTGLSCDTCANPIFTADSSMNYTVRIWNNDSCSVVRPLQILVSQPRIDTLIISPPTCGTNNVIKLTV